MDYLSHFEKATKELEDFYLGVPDGSEDLSFDYLAQAQQQKAGPSSDIKKSGPSDPTAETNPRKQQSARFRHVRNDSNGGSFGTTTPVAATSVTPPEDHIGILIGRTIMEARHHIVPKG